MKNRFTIALLLLHGLFASCVFAQLPAFPGAAGFGKNAKGARGGSNPDVYIVTSLSDNGAQGTLRHAIDSMSGDNGRFVVFRVGGVIMLSQGSPLVIDCPYVTIAGQTAPNGGICIQGESIFVNAHDVIIRGLRSRPGDYHSTSYQPTTSRDGIKVGETTAATPTIKDIIIDHCSFSWSLDEIASAYRACRNVTYQYNLFAEPLDKSIHYDENATAWVNDSHSMGPTIGPYAENITLYRNVSAHADNRNPNVKETDQAEIINNIFYNFGQRGIQLFDEAAGQSLKANVIGNMWLAGPSSSSDKWRVFHFKSANATNGTEIYLSGNVAHVGSQHLAHDEDPIAQSFHQAQDGTNLSQALQSSPVFTGIPSNEITALSAAETELDFLLDEVGARWPMRDAIDARVIDDVINGTGSIIDRVSLPAGTVGNWVNPVGSRVAPSVDSSGDPKVPDYQTLGSGPAADNDNDGIPDSLESTYGSNPLADGDGDGYLNIEEYINSIIGSGGSSGSPPAAPTGLSATAVSSSQINLSWTDASNNETGFEVDRALNSGFTSGLVANAYTTGANPSLPVAASGLSPSTTYYFRARATNSFGDSSNSNTANATTQGNYVNTVDDFEDGDVTSPSPGWTTHVGSGATVTITPKAVTGSEPAAHSGSTYHMMVEYNNASTWKYAVLNRGTSVFGGPWNTNGVNAIRFYLKGSVNNPGTIANSGLKLQLREGDTGDRWSYDIGTAVQNNNSTWTQLTVPLSSFYGESSNPGGAVFNLSAIDQIRVFNNSVNAAIKIRIDRIEAIAQ